MLKQYRIKNRAWLIIKDKAESDFNAPTYDYEVNIHGMIGDDYYGNQGYSAQQFQEVVKTIGKDKSAIVNIHSEGGNIWDGFAIANMIKAHSNIDTRVLGLAASSADVIFQSGRKRIMSHTSMRMGHNPSSMFVAMGNAEQLRQQMDDYEKTIDRLDKHANTLAEMYARVSGNTKKDCREMMDAEEFMDGDESMDKGFCDCVNDEFPISCQLERLNLSAFKKLPTNVLNQFALPVQGGTNKKNQTNVNKQAKIALLNSWGVSLLAGITADSVTDEWLDTELAKGKPVVKITRDQNIVLLNLWNVTTPNNATDSDIEALVAKGKPSVSPATPPVADLDNHPVVVALRNQANEQRRERIRTEITNLASVEGGSRIPLNSIDGWVADAFTAQDDPAKGNPVIARLKLLEPKQVGISPVSDIVIGDTFDIKEIARLAAKCFAPRDAMFRNPSLVTNAGHRKQLFVGAKKIGVVLKRQLDAVTAKIPESPEGGFNKQRAEAIANWMENVLRPMVNADTGTTYGAPGTGVGGVEVFSNLQRQVIMSEAMRAFKRRMLPLTSFAHIWNAVPLQGTDQLVVPYYPLFAAASSRFIQGQGYQFGNTDVAEDKNITVGGVGTPAKIAGQDRAYQALTYSAYLVRRQPWVEIQRLAVMRAEQLALDIMNDVITAWVLKANFGNAVWAGAPAGFDDTTVALLAGAARKSDWPEGGRNLIIGTDYWVNLASSPYVKAFLNIGDTGTIREGRIGGLYGFEDTIENPRIPVTPDGNLVGWISYPSAVLCATSPILPAPGEMKLMVSYDVVVDPVDSDEEGGTGLAFEYKYWGEPWNSADREIIECNYGSGLGELAALKRLVANGN